MSTASPVSKASGSWYFPFQATCELLKATVNTANVQYSERGGAALQSAARGRDQVWTRRVTCVFNLMSSASGAHLPGAHTHPWGSHPQGRAHTHTPGPHPPQRLTPPGTTQSRSCISAPQIAHRAHRQQRLLSTEPLSQRRSPSRRCPTS